MLCGMTVNLDDYEEFVFTEPTWGRLWRRSPRPEDDAIPGEWHILTDILAVKGSTVEDIEAGRATHVQTLCKKAFFKSMVEGVVDFLSRD